MNLLPKSHKELGEKDYWNKFFKNRGKKAFEWYGEYLELCTYLHKYIKNTDHLLITGCGNSNLCADLYDIGYNNITNIDVSEVVIKQMQSIHSKRNKMKFLHMDATNTTFENESFNVVLDKATLDALMPDDKIETLEMIDKYFSEIKRLLKLGGRYVCISLLQEHILKKLVDSFCDGAWMFRVVRCHDAETKNAEDVDGKTFPVFVVVATKFKQLPHLILEICLAGDKMQRLTDPKDLLSSVKSAQDAAVVTNGLASTTLGNGEEVTLDLCEPGTEAPRYSLYVIDHQQKQNNNKYGVFIVPQGRENEWLFGTPDGRIELHKSAGFNRLVVVMMHRGQLYTDLDAVKKEMAHTAKMLAPKGFAGQIPFLSIGKDVGKRVKVFEGTSKCSGDYVVEDVDVEGKTSRRLIFLDNQFLVQSEAKMINVQTKGKSKTIVDFGNISFYHSCMSIGVNISQCEGATGRVAVLGLGGGSLCMFLKKCFNKLSMIAVELDPAMFEVAKNQFGLTIDKQLGVQIKDGLDFLKEEASIEAKYDAILFDMDSKDRGMGLSCPPPQFMHEEVLQHLVKIIGDHGHFILNLVCRDTTLHDSIVNTLQSHFRHMIAIKLYDEVNEVIFATNSNRKYSIEDLEEATMSLNKKARDAKLVKIKCVDLVEVTQSARVIV